MLLRQTSFRFFAGPDMKELREILGAGLYEPDSASGYDLKPNLAPTQKRFWFDEQEFPVWTNNLGCYDTPLIEHDASSEFALLLGDSFAFGSNEFSRSYGATLERALEYRVLKCGVNGFGIAQSRAKLKKVLRKLKDKPKVIVLLYFVGNDMFDDYVSPAMAVHDNFLVPRINYADSNFNTGNFPSLTETQLNERQTKSLASIRPPGQPYSVLLKMLQMQFSKDSPNPFHSVPDHTSSSHSPSLLVFGPDKFAWIEGAWGKHKDELTNLAADGRALDIPLAVVVAPASEQVYPFLMSEEEKKITSIDIPDKILSEFFKAQNINSLFLRPLFQPIANTSTRTTLDPQVDLFKRFDGHFSELGDRVAALQTAKFLAQNKIVVPGTDVAKTVDKPLNEIYTRLAVTQPASAKIEIVAYGPKRVDRIVACQALANGQCGLWFKLRKLPKGLSASIGERSLSIVVNHAESLFTTEVAPAELAKSSFTIDLKDSEGEFTAAAVTF